MNTDILNLWMKITSNFVCRNGDCTNCHSIYNTTDCTDDIRIDSKHALKFIGRMTELLRLKAEDMPFDLDISDEDFLKLLEEAVTVDK